VWIIERLIAAGAPAELETISARSRLQGADAQRAEIRRHRWSNKYFIYRSAYVLISDHGPNGEIGR